MLKNHPDSDLFGLILLSFLDLFQPLFLFRGVVSSQEGCSPWRLNLAQSCPFTENSLLLFQVQFLRLPQA